MTAAHDDACTKCGQGRLAITTRRNWHAYGDRYRTTLICRACGWDHGEPTAADYASWRAS